MFYLLSLCFTRYSAFDPVWMRQQKLLEALVLASSTFVTRTVMSTSDRYAEGHFPCILKLRLSVHHWQLSQSDGCLASRPAASTFKRLMKGLWKLLSFTPTTLPCHQGLDAGIKTLPKAREETVNFMLLSSSRVVFALLWSHWSAYLEVAE